MITSKFASALLALTFGCATMLRADADLQARVAVALAQDDGWDQTGAELIAEELELSFALHESTGTLDQRISALRRLNGMLDAQRLAVAHPGYLDAVLLEPELFSTALQRLGLDMTGEEQILAAILVRPTGEGLRDSARLIDHFGADLARVASEPGFADLFEALSWVADDAPPDLTNWLGRRLHEMSREDLAMMTELFLTHRVQLRDREHAPYLDNAWTVLNQVRRSNPALFNLLLSHREIWRAISPDLVEALRIQLKRDTKHAQNALVFLLGSDGALFEMSESLIWGHPLTDDSLETAITIFKADKDEAMAAMFQFRDNPRFWHFVGDENNRRLLPCLVKKSESGLSALEKIFESGSDPVADDCRDEANVFVQTIPLYSVYSLVKKFRAGAPIEAADLGGLGVDVATTLLPVGKALGIGGRLGLRLRLFHAPARAGEAINTTKGAAKTGMVLRSGFGTTVASALEAEATRVVNAGMQTGADNALRMGHEALTKAMATNPRMSAVTRNLITEYAEGAPIDLAISALSTEFLRCTSQPVRQMEEDRLCQDVVPMVIASTAPEDTP